MDPPKNDVIYHDRRSIFVIKPTGKLKQLYVPFAVKNVLPLEGVPVDTSVFVEEIQPHKRYRIIYRVFQVWYPYWCFKI